MGRFSTMFFDVEIFKHRGYDFAPWSLLDCGMTKENGNYFVKGDPIRFIHFSGYGKTAQKCMRDWLPEGEHPLENCMQNTVNITRRITVMECQERLGVIAATILEKA